MNDRQLKNFLSDAFDDTPPVFHQAVTRAAGQAKHRMPHRLAFALCAALLFCLAGVAGAVMNHYGVLNFNADWEDTYYFALPEAKNMVQYNLCQVRTGNILWRVKEAIYDGRVLRVLYSATNLLETKPFTQEQRSGDPMSQADAYYDAMVQESGVRLACEGNGEIIVNGLGVNLNSVDRRLGEDIGEVEFWADSRMEYYDPQKKAFCRLVPEGRLEIELLFKGESDGALAFTLNAGDFASFYALALPEPYTLKDGAQVTFTDLHFSPATVYITYQVTYPAGTKMFDLNTMYEQDEQIPYYDASSLVNAKGEALGVWKDGYIGNPAQQENGAIVMEYHAEFAPSTLYTATNYLFIGENKVPIPMVYENQ